MSKSNEIKARTITLEIENPSIRKTVVLWECEIDSNCCDITQHQGKWCGKQLVFKYFHPNHGELALDVIYAGNTKLLVRTQTSKKIGMYFGCHLSADEHLGIRIG